MPDKRLYRPLRAISGHFRGRPDPVTAPVAPMRDSTQPSAATVSRLFINRCCVTGFYSKYPAFIFSSTGWNPPILVLLNKPAHSRGGDQGVTHVVRWILGSLLQVGTEVGTKLSYIVSLYLDSGQLGLA